MAVETGSSGLFVGRAETVEALHRRLEDARSGKGGVTLLLGSTGVGKSTLVTEFAKEIRAQGVRCFIGRALALDDPPPFSLIHSAFGSAQDDPTQAPDEVALFESDQWTPDVTSLLAEAALPSRVGIEQRLLRALDETEARRQKSRDRVLNGIVQRFLELTQNGLTVLILDELHRADDSSLTAMEFLAKQLQDRPLWILGTSRPFASLSEARRARLEEFEYATHAQHIVLHPLRAEEVASFLHATDPFREFAAEEVARRYAATGGNPLLLQQLGRRIISTGGLRLPAERAPPTVDEESQRILDIAAALGPAFSFQLLLGASGEEENRLKKIVEGLVGRGLLNERPEGLLEFPQDRLREEAYGHLSETRRRAIHQRAGETREAMGSASPDGVFGLARDFYLGKIDRKSIDYNRIAADIAEGASAPDVARDFLTHALESQRDLAPEDREGESELVLELARVTYELGHLEEAEKILREFIDREKADPRFSPRLRGSLEIFLARVLTAKGDLRTARPLVERILADPDLQGDLLLLVGAHAHLGLALYYDGKYAEALAHQTEVIELGRKAGAERSAIQGQLWRAGCLAMMDQMPQALVEARQVALALEQTGSVTDAAQGHLFLGNLLADDKSTPEIRREALAELEKAVRLGAKSQDPRRVGWALYHTAELLRDERRFKEASDDAQQADAILGRVGDLVGKALAIKVRGQVAMEQGDYDRAEADFKEANRLLQGLNNRLNEIDVVLRMAQLSVARGDRGAALRHVAELERLNLTTARSDLAKEFEELKRKLGTTEGSKAAT